MEQENQGKNQRLTHNELSMPHFDQEATLLSARQVVPLIEVKRETRWRRQMVFGLIGLMALLGGMIYGTLFYRPRVERETLAHEIMPATSGHDASQSGEAGGSSRENSASTSKSEDPDSPAPQEFDEDPRPVSRQSTGSETATEGDRSSDGQNDLGERKNRRAERTAARQKRREERELRHQRPKSSDDLLRIQEIFEGPQRP